MSGDVNEAIVQSGFSGALGAEQTDRGFCRSVSSDSGSSRTPSESSAAGPAKMNDANPEGLALVRKEVLSLVLSLSSAVGSKSHQEGLMT